MLTYIKDRITSKAPAGAKRSSLWSKVRVAFLKNNPTCAVCGGKEKLEVHHIVPFHKDPSLELDLNNLITLCESKKKGSNCHLLFGHLGNYQKVNKDVVKDAKIWNEKLK